MSDSLLTSSHYRLNQPRPAWWRILLRTNTLDRVAITDRVPLYSATGAGIPAQYPRLAGQHQDYTFAQLQAFKSGARSMSRAACRRRV